MALTDKSILSLLTDEIVGRDNDTAHEEYSTSYTVMAPEDHVVDDRLVDQVSHFDEARDGGHHPEDRHCLVGGLFEGGGVALIMEWELNGEERAWGSSLLPIWG